MMTTPSAHVASRILGILLVLPLLLLLTSCGSSPQHSQVRSTPAPVVAAAPIELAAGVAPVFPAPVFPAPVFPAEGFPAEDQAGVRPATDRSAGTSLLQLTSPDSVTGEPPLEEVVVKIPSAEPIEAIDQALARAAEARRVPDAVIPAVVIPAVVIPTAIIPTAIIPAQPPVEDIAQEAAKEIKSDPIAIVQVVSSIVEPIVTTPSKPPTIIETVPVNGLETLILMCGPGSLTVVRDESADQIVATAEVACQASDPQRQRELTAGVRISITGGTLGLKRIRVIEPQLEAGEDCQVHLHIVLPAGDDSRLAFKIQDSSGDIAIVGFHGDLSITSLRGSIDVVDGTGSLVISSGHGPCSVSNFEGPVKVRDGAGDCTLGQVTGDIEVWGRDGALEIRYITGNVTAIDGRDGILVQSVEGNLTMYGIPLGDSTIEGVSGSVMSKTGAP